MSSLSAGPSGLLGPSRVRPSGESAPPGGARGRTWRLAAGGAVLALVAAGCGGDDGAPGGDGAAASAGGMTLEITAPDDGATVEVPFTVELSSSEELGPTESGAHHVHVFFDGDDTEYQVVEGGSVEITDLPAGEHQIDASLRNADHSPAGVETSVTVTVGEGGTGDDGVLPGY
ncbi:hypothetical protein M1843_08455 [Isoptericola sp. 4D.3]|uniref:DUF4399 domain-containing protein n=1 Tax=Isoptericola peretonis TaxID=2918523 RepID=A0ABT0J2S8_9MICO|nr:hypothetical protein [Isoptericola sp. 4D.3]